MKRFSSLLLISLAIGVLLTACGEDPKDNPVLQEAFAVHTEAVNIHNEVMSQIADIDAMKSTMEAEMAALDREDTANSAKIRSIGSVISQSIAIKDEMNNWMANLSEVPGFDDHDHGHGEGEGHDHDHSHDDAAAKLTPEQVLAVQKEQLELIKQMKVRAGSILSSGNALKAE